MHLSHGLVYPLSLLPWPLLWKHSCDFTPVAACECSSVPALFLESNRFSSSETHESSYMLSSALPSQDAHKQDGRFLHFHIKFLQIHRKVCSLKKKKWQADKHRKGYKGDSYSVFQPYSSIINDTSTHYWSKFNMRWQEHSVRPGSLFLLAYTETCLAQTKLTLVRDV